MTVTALDGEAASTTAFVTTVFASTAGASVVSAEADVSVAVVLSFSATISSYANRIRAAEVQFGLTPASANRVEGFGGPIAMPAGKEDSIEKALCG